MELGKLERVELRNVWNSECYDFTPWLALPENIAILSETLGIDLEVEAKEKDVGPFRADILCKDTANNSWVLIENQLERTDHLHLGQILTYAAGLNSVTTIWIAERFTEEHRAALDWLNNHTDEDISFFGLEIEIWRIGQSLPAPKFNVVCKPNDWSKSVSARAVAIDLTESKKLQLEFWTAFREFVTAKNSFIKTTKPLPQHWMNIALGRTGLKLCAIASLYDSEQGSFGSHELRAEVVTEGPNSKMYFKQLEILKSEIEAKVGEPLNWYNPGANICRIFIRRTAKITEENTWPELQGWLLSKLEKLYTVFSPYVRQLQTIEQQTSA